MQGTSSEAPVFLEDVNRHRLLCIQIKQVMFVWLCRFGATIGKTNQVAHPHYIRTVVWRRCHEVALLCY